MSERPKEPTERADVFEDDLTEEREITPEQREDLAHSLAMDPDTPESEPTA